MGTPAGIWLRVSDESQDENNQRPDLETYCTAHGYAVRPEHVFRVHGKSAWKPGKLDADKRRVLDAVRNGEIAVIVVWSVDRWSRGGIADLLDGMRLVREAGGRIEFVKDEALNVPGPAQELLLAVLGWVAAWESAHKSDRTKNGMERRRGEGAIMGGRVPFGYRLEDGQKIRDEAKLAVVAEVFERSAQGQSTAVIADWLRRTGYARRDNTVADLLRNDVYVADGVVSGALAKAAVGALEARRTGCARRVSEADCSGMLHCVCGKPMHRVMAGGMPGKGVEPTRYYRCREHEREKLPDGKLTPAPMVRADDADRLVGHVMANDWWPWMIPVRLGGDTREADAAKLMKRLTTARTRAESDEIWDQVDAVRAREPEPERIEWAESGKTRGQHWTEITFPERRAWLESEGTRIVTWNSRESAGPEITVVRDSDGGSAWALGRVRLVVGHGELSVSLKRPGEINRELE